MGGLAVRAGGPFDYAHGRLLAGRMNSIFKIIIVRYLYCMVMEGCHGFRCLTSLARKVEIPPG